MLRIRRDEIKRIVIVCSAAIALQIGLPGASAQPDPTQQAAQAAQQATMISMQAAQQANEQATQAALQAGQQAAINSPAAGPTHPGGYGRADKPVFSPRPGKFTGQVDVTISDPTTPKAEIFYTLDGSAPTTASIRYTGPIQVTSSTRLRAIARSPIYSPSRVVSAKYEIR